MHELPTNGLWCWSPSSSDETPPGLNLSATCFNRQIYVDASKDSIDEEEGPMRSFQEEESNCTARSKAYAPRWMSLSSCVGLLVLQPSNTHQLRSNNAISRILQNGFSPFQRIGGETDVQSRKGLSCLLCLQEFDAAFVEFSPLSSMKVTRFGVVYYCMYDVLLIAWCAIPTAWFHRWL